jgi:hypothetical protein
MKTNRVREDERNIKRYTKRREIQPYSVTGRNEEILARTKTYTNIEIQIMTKRETDEYKTEKKRKIQVDIKREGTIRVKRGNKKFYFSFVESVSVTLSQCSAYSPERFPLSFQWDRRIDGCRKGCCVCWTKSILLTDIWPIQFSTKRLIVIITSSLIMTIIYNCIMHFNCLHGHFHEIQI